MAFTSLIDTATLADRLDDRNVVVVDCRFALNDPAWGEREYEARHIPHARYAHLDRDLSGVKTGTNGRHPLPGREVLKETFGRLGIADTAQVVAYDQDAGMFASRLWWLLRWLGHEAVAVLDGGFAKWLGEGRQTSSGRDIHGVVPFNGSACGDPTASADEVQGLIGKPDWRIVDARAPERYRGDTEPLDKTAGHIPGATNYFYQWNLDEHGTFRAPEDLRRRWHAIIGDVPPERVVAYCGSGVTACHNLLALEHAGLHGAKLYPGSWSEWSSDPSRPVESSRREREEP